MRPIMQFCNNFVVFTLIGLLRVLTDFHSNFTLVNDKAESGQMIVPGFRFVNLFVLKLCFRKFKR